MSVFKTVAGILVRKVEKRFNDGGSGFYCTIYKPDESMMNFWCPREYGDSIGEPESIEQYEPVLEQKFRLEVKEWNGNVKYTLQPS